MKNHFKERYSEPSIVYRIIKKPGDRDATDADLKKMETNYLCTGH
jgi:hypothetical protein